MRMGADVVLTFCNASAVSRSDVPSTTRRVALSSSNRHAFVIAPGRSRRSLSCKSRKTTRLPRWAIRPPFGSRWPPLRLPPPVRSALLSS